MVPLMCNKKKREDIELSSELIDSQLEMSTFMIKQKLLWQDYKKKLSVKDLEKLRSPGTVFKLDRAEFFKTIAVPKKAKSNQGSVAPEEMKDITAANISDGPQNPNGSRNVTEQNLVVNENPNRNRTVINQKAGV